MKNSFNNVFPFLLKAGSGICLLLCFMAGSLSAQDENATAETSTRKPVKNTFESALVIDNQTVMVPIKGTFEMDIQHRFGTVKNGYDDVWGLFAPSNIRLGFSYAPISKLYVGLGLTKERMKWDFSIKYALLQQMKGGGMPFSLTYFGNFAVDGRDKKYFGKGTDRLSFFHQLILARKVTEKFSLQVSPSLSYFNNVEGYLDENGDVQKKMDNAHFAVAFMGRYKITETMAIIAGADQPVTVHPTNNPYPNICFGLEITTSAHSFQVFAGNYSSIVPQSNNVFNQNDYKNGQFLIGFNITRLWNL
ncbi:MAG: hypothetical protein KA165_15530 [Saprospiraceae bacterium]|nr:hypothetical protein [Saprospiraceae bacterium]